MLKPHYERLEQQLKQQPDITLKEIREELGLAVSLQAISKALRKLGYTFKKSYELQNKTVLMLPLPGSAGGKNVSRLTTKS